MLLHLAWRRNLDGFDVALAANRIAARGAPLWWLGAAGPRRMSLAITSCDVDEGTVADRLVRFSACVATSWHAELPDEAVAIAPPRIALLAGSAIAYSRLAFYAMALARLGFDFALVDGTAIAGGVLAGYDLLVLPSSGSARCGGSMRRKA